MTVTIDKTAIGVLEKEGRLLYPGEWDRCTLFDVNFQPKNMSVAELETGLQSTPVEPEP